MVSLGVPVASSDGGPSPTSLTAMTLTAYSTPSVSPVMVWVIRLAVSSETSAGVSQLPAVSFHCTQYSVMAEPPSVEGASQDTSSAPVSRRETFRCSGAPGTFANTAVAAALVSVSGLFLSSKNDTFTLMVRPASSSTKV